MYQRATRPHFFRFQSSPSTLRTTRWPARRGIHVTALVPTLKKRATS